MKINYNDLIIGKDISSSSSRSGSHVYAGKYKDQDVAIKIFDKKNPKSLKYRLYGISNVCLMEYNNLLEAKNKCLQISHLLQEPVGVCKTSEGIDTLVTRLIKNDDNNVSVLLKDSKNLIDKNFIEELEHVLYFIGSKGVYHMDLNDGSNILVQINGKLTPRIIDFQSMNESYYPLLKLTKYFGIDSAKKRYFRRVNRMLNFLKEKLNEN